MPIKFACPSCKKQYQVKDEMAGRKAKCVCGQSMQLPKAKPKPAAAETPVLPPAPAEDDLFGMGSGFGETMSDRNDLFVDLPPATPGASTMAPAPTVKASAPLPSEPKKKKKKKRKRAESDDDNLSVVGAILYIPGGIIMCVIGCAGLYYVFTTGVRGRNRSKAIALAGGLAIFGPIVTIGGIVKLCSSIWGAVQGE